MDYKIGDQCVECSDNYALEYTIIMNDDNLVIIYFTYLIAGS